MLVKSKLANDYVADLKTTFGILRKFYVKLNLLKCVFGIGFGKFWGFMVN